MRAFGVLVLPLLLACGSKGGFPPPRDGGVKVSQCAAQSPDMTFFFTFNGTESGNLGGLAGADGICNAAAAASGSTRPNWVAYLSALNDATLGRVDARDRIGNGPWANYCGDPIGNFEDIHGRFGIPAYLMKAETGFEITQDRTAGIAARAWDIFTGSDADGRLIGGSGPDDPPRTCADWTSGLPSDIAFIGHEDTDVADGTWNSAHPTEGCDRDSLQNTLAIGRIYCFALDD